MNKTPPKHTADKRSAYMNANASPLQKSMPPKVRPQQRSAVLRAGLGVGLLTGLFALSGVDAGMGSLLGLAAVDVPPTHSSPGARIEGTILYNGKPACSNTAALATIQLMEVEKRQGVPITVTYDNKTSKYVVRGVPPGKYTPFVRLEAGYPFDMESGGDYFSRLSGMNEDIVVAPDEELIKRDLKVVKVIHLKRPVDNQQRRTRAEDPPEVLYESFNGPSAEVFEWDAVPGAATYKAYFLLQEGDHQNVSKQKRVDYQEKTVLVPQVTPELHTTGSNQFYMFRVDALNRQGELIGVFNNYYKNGSGGWFEFVLQKKAVGQ